MQETLSTLQRRDDERTQLVQAPPSGTAIAQTRAAQEVQAAMVVAKNFPREMARSMARIEQACCRPTLAAKSQYHYPRGGQEISGISIRLAEVLAQGWGNIDFGVIEVEQRNGESQMLAYCWDLETNMRSTRLFTVPHVREKKGRNGLEQIALEGARDIYEVTANMAARRMRACILQVIPVDVQEEAVELCNKTLGADFTEEKRDKMVEAFKETFGVELVQIEAFIGKRLKNFDGGTYVRLRRVYQTLQDGFASVADFFPPQVELEGKPRGKIGFGKDKDNKKVGEKKTEEVPQSEQEAPPDHDPEQESPTDEQESVQVAEPGSGVFADDTICVCKICKRQFPHKLRIKGVIEDECPFCESTDWDASTKPKREIWKCSAGHTFPMTDVLVTPLSRTGKCPACTEANIKIEKAS